MLAICLCPCQASGLCLRHPRAQHPPASSDHVCIEYHGKTRRGVACSEETALSGGPQEDITNTACRRTVPQHDKHYECMNLAREMRQICDHTYATNTANTRSQHTTNATNGSHSTLHRYQHVVIAHDKNAKPRSRRRASVPTSILYTAASRFSQ